MSLVEFTGLSLLDSLADSVSPSESAFFIPRRHSPEAGIQGRTATVLGSRFRGNDRSIRSQVFFAG